MKLQDFICILITATAQHTVKRFETYICSIPDAEIPLSSQYDDESSRGTLTGKLLATHI